MKQKVINISKRNDLNIKEKYDLIEELQNEFNRFCGETKKRLTAHYTYCPYCKTYYRNNTWEIEYFSRREQVYDNGNCSIDSCTAAVLKTIDIPYVRKTCPTGHVIEERANDKDSNLV